MSFLTCQGISRYFRTFFWHVDSVIWLGYKSAKNIAEIIPPFKHDSLLEEEFPSHISSKELLSTRLTTEKLWACKSSSRHWTARPSYWIWILQTPLGTSRSGFKIRKECLLTSSVWSSRASNWKMSEHWGTTTFDRSPLYTWFFDYDDWCRVLVFQAEMILSATCDRADGSSFQ